MACECLERQLQEIEALQATFPEPGALAFSFSEVAALEQLRALVESQSVGSNPQEVANIGGTVNLQDCTLSGQTVGLHFQLPSTYPLQKPSYQVLCAADRSAYDSLVKAVKTSIDDNPGAEVLLLALQALKATAQALSVSELESVSKLPHSLDPAGKIARKAIWFHHIKAASKRKAIVAWGKELGVRGYSKPGFPGILLCEGADDNIQEYCTRIRALRWQAMSIRAEESESSPSGDWEHLFRFSEELQELGEGDMDVLAAECRSANLEHLFLAVVKL